MFSRLISAPVALVWEMWSDVRHLHEWFGPAGFTTTTQEFAFEPGRRVRPVKSAIIVTAVRTASRARMRPSPHHVATCDR